jgi:uracil-DNA glycosylase
MSTIDLKEIQQKLYEKLKPSGWADKLKGFILSDDFYNILEQLLAESQNEKRFTPVLKQLFRAFEECPYEELKVIIVGQDPYPKAGIADGISFSSSNSGTIPASLRYIFGELEHTVDPEYVQNPDLKRWSNQGVLMLNTALTTTAGKIGMHVELWRPFMNYLFDVLNTYNNGLIYVFMGLKAKAWKDQVNKNNFKFFTTHPASAAYKGSQRWDSGDVFNQVNKVVKDHYNTEIIW